MRILGIDYTRIRNMQALFVNYYRGADVGEDDIEDEPVTPDEPEDPEVPTPDEGPKPPVDTKGGQRRVQS